jgi:hypothetical protein
MLIKLAKLLKSEEMKRKQVIPHIRKVKNNINLLQR